MKRGLILIGLLLTSAAFLTAQDSRQASVTLKAAIVAETIEQDLPKAITLYERALKEAGADRSLADEIGMRLTTARGRLKPGTAGFTQVAPDLNVGFNRALSPDGVFAASIEDGRLVVRNLQTKKDVPLPGAQAGRATTPIWAPDSRRVATLLPDADNRGQICVTEILSGTTTVVVAAEMGADSVTAWTTSDELFFRTPRGSGSADWSLIPANRSSQPRTVYTTGGDAGFMGPITPDGGSLILVKGQHLALYNIRTRETQALTDGPATENRPVLSPDGHLLAFLSNRDASWGLYVAPLDEVPVKHAVRVGSIDESALTGNRLGFWFSSQGVLNLITNPTRDNIYRASRQGATTFERLTEAFGYSPSVSPDGSHIAYRTRFGTEAGIGVMTASGEREQLLLSVPESGENRLFWRDSDTILFYGSPGGKLGIHSLNVNTRAVELVASGQVHWWGYDAPSKELVYAPGPRPRSLSEAQRLAARSPADGSERTISDIPALFSFVICSGTKSIVYSKLLARQEGQWTMELRSMLLDGTNDRNVRAADAAPTGIIAASCSSDGRYLLFFRNRPRVLDLQTGAESLLAETPAGIDWDDSGSLAPDGSFAVVSGSVIVTERRAWSGVTYAAVKARSTGR